MPEPYTLQTPPLRPGVRASPPYWEEFDVDLEPERSVLDGDPPGARRPGRLDRPSAARARPRSAAPAACASTASPRSPATPRWPAPPRSKDGRRHDHGRADGQHARDQGPDRGHGRRPLEEGPARRAVAAARGRPAGARVHRASRGHDRHHPVDGLHPVRRLRARLPVAGGRPRVHRPGRARPRPTASWATRATASTRSACSTSPRTRTASTTAPTASPASRSARRTWRR